MFSLLGWYVVIGLVVAGLELWDFTEYKTSDGKWLWKNLVTDLVVSAAIWPFTVYALIKGKTK